MSTASPNPDSGPLAAAVDAEARAAEQLATHLGGVRRCIESRDTEGLEGAVEVSQRAADDLTRAGTERLRHTAAVARELGLNDGATLAVVATRSSHDLQRAADRLRDCLQSVARVSAALGIAVRFGANSCERLLDLQRSVLGAAAGYGADGRLGAQVQRLGRHA